jgi:hypothetical protein
MKLFVIQPSEKVQRGFITLRWCVGCCLLILGLTPGIRTTVTAGPPAVVASDSVFLPGEELTYNVSYASFDLGRVRIKVLGNTDKDHPNVLRATAFIDSYKGVPFVDLHSIYENMMHSGGYSLWFHSHDRIERNTRTYNYSFDYSRHSLLVEEGNAEGIIDHRDTVRIDTLYQDGLSLFFYARKHCRTPDTLTVPTFVMEKKGSTLFRFTGERTEEKIEAVDYPIDLVHFTGEAGFVGVFGLTGGFEGWFSNDAVCVPVVASMQVLIGHVRIELISWSRPGWTPPRAPGKGGR